MAFLNSLDLVAEVEVIVVDAVDALTSLTRIEEAMRIEVAILDGIVVVVILNVVVLANLHTSILLQMLTERRNRITNIA